MMELNHWYLHTHSSSTTFDDPYKSPEQNQPAIGISGIVSGHPDFEDGQEITTSMIIDVYEHEDQTYMRTFSGSLYKLMEPKSTYEQFMPNAKKRLVDTFSRIRSSVSAECEDRQ